MGVKKKTRALTCAVDDLVLLPKEHRAGREARLRVRAAVEQTGGPFLGHCRVGRMACCKGRGEGWCATNNAILVLTRLTMLNEARARDRATVNTCTSTVQARYKYSMY